MPAQPDELGSPSMRKRKHSDSETSSTEYKKTSESTEDEIQAVESIRTCKDYYEILGITKDAGESELRKQYRKLALQFHPDKNKTPGAVEAFKAIGNAFSVLSDPAKRKQYDTYGLEAMQAAQNRNGHGAYPASFEGDITPEELFNMFFNGAPTYVRRGNQWHRYTRQSNVQDNRSVLMQILPLLFILSVSVLSSFLVSEPPYSLQRTTKYLYEQKTENLDIPYYVKENFMSDYKGKIGYIEKQVEDEYILHIRSSCFRERNYKETMIWRAKHYRDVNFEERARELRTPSCDTLNSLYISMKEH